MKALVIILIICLSGCATYERRETTPEQRALAMQYFLGTQQPRPYVLPTPQAHTYNQPPMYYNCIQNVGSGTPTYACTPQ